MFGTPVFTRGMGEIVLQDDVYRGFTAQQEAAVKTWVGNLQKKHSKTLNDMLRVKGAIGSLKLPGNPADTGETNKRMALYNEGVEMAKHRIWEVMKAGQKMAKTGVTSSIGFNFYDLRGPVELLFPFYTPFRNMTPRPAPPNAGVGTAAHWQRITQPGYAYPGVPEAQRAQITTPNMVPCIATYKEFGKENQVTYTAEFAGEGFNDNLATERLDGLLALFLAEEAQILNGNGGNGTGSNGFQLGNGPTPTVVAGTALTPAGTLTSGHYVSVWCVALTAMGNPQNAQYGYYNAPLTVAGGLTPYFNYNAPGTNQQITIAGGMSALSAMSNTATPFEVTATLNVVASVTPKVGAMGGYAWFVDYEATNTGSTAGAYLYAITQFPTVTISTPPTVTTTAAAFVAAGGNVDESANPYDMDGLFAWAATYGQWVNQSGQGPSASNSLTSLGNGKVLEVENMLSTLFSIFQTGIDEIWGDLIAVECLDNAVRYGGTSATGYQIILQRDTQNNILGGFVVSGYQSRYAVGNPTGANAIPIRIHPMIPPGTLLFNIRTVPPGYSHSRLPYIYGMLVQRDYYGIEWPPVFRAFNFGTYVHETLAHHFPGLLGVITGIGAFVAP